MYHKFLDRVINLPNLPLHKGRPGGVNVLSPLMGEGKGEGDDPFLENLS
jgi:hypothetical protein